VRVSTDPLIIIKQARLLDSDELHTITLRDGVVDSITPSRRADKTHTANSIVNADMPDALCIDANDQIAVPGMCDLYARLREPVLTRKGSIASESYAALTAGFTRVLCSPDTQPAIDSVATVQLIKQRAEMAQGAQIFPIAALTVGLAGEQLSELATLQAAGCPVASQADYPLGNTNVLFSAMEYAASFSMPLFMTARDAQLGADGCAHAGAIATKLGLPEIPVAAETVALARLLELCRETSCRLHISRVSSARALQMIDAAKQAGLPVTCDVGLHHLFFTDDHLSGYDSNFHSEVPFRSIADRTALRQGVINGVVDAICTDHAPHERDASLAPFPSTESGLSAYPWSMPLILQLSDILGFTLQQVFEKLSTAPKRIINGSSSSGLKPGDIAEFFLLSDTPIEPVSVMLESAGTNHPLSIHSPAEIGLKPLHGKVTHVFLQNRHHTI
jgi:dihydroorotase